MSATAAQVERLVRAWRRVDRDAQPDAEQVLLASRALSMHMDEDGMVVLRGRLPPEVGAVLLRAVEAALEQVPASADGGAPTIAQRRADALGLVAESALAGGLDPGNPADRFQVTVHVQADALPARDPAAAAPHVSAETRAVSLTPSRRSLRQRALSRRIRPESEPVVAVRTELRVPASPLSRRGRPVAPVASKAGVQTPPAGCPFARSRHRAPVTPRTPITRKTEVQGSLAGRHGRSRRPLPRLTFPRQRSRSAKRLLNVWLR